MWGEIVFYFVRSQLFGYCASPFHIYLLHVMMAQPLSPLSRQRRRCWLSCILNLPLFCAFFPPLYCCFVLQFFFNMLLCSLRFLLHSFIIATTATTNFFFSLFFALSLFQVAVCKATCLSFAAFSLIFDGLWLVCLLLCQHFLLFFAKALHTYYGFLPCI